MNKKLSEEEIELQMEKSLEKIPSEIKKIKFILEIAKSINRVKRLFKFKK